MARQLDIFGGSTAYGPQRQPTANVGQQQLEARLQRQKMNRERIEGTEAVRSRNFGDEGAEPDEYGDLPDTHTTPMSDFGIREVNGNVFSDRSNKVSYGPFDSPVFRKAGRVVEQPLYGPDAVTTMQSTVHPGRVAELASDPMSGSDPRFPGQELPLAVEMKVSPRDSYGGTDSDRSRGRVTTPVIWNGNHRVASAVDRGEMFTPMQTIRQQDKPYASEVAARDRARFESVRSDRQFLGMTRMAERDATLKEHDW